MIKFHFFTVLLSLLVLSSSCNKRNKLIGVKIYEYNEDFNELVNTWNEIGINTAFISIELSKNKEFRAVLKENGIQVFVIFPVFFNPEALKRDSSLYAITNKGQIAKDGWVNFVCPSRKEYRVEKVRSIASDILESRPDGISIDFIRQFVFWEKVYPDRDIESISRACFCNNCIDDFEHIKKVRLPDTLKNTVEKSNYILNNFSNLWNGYRTDLIASMVSEIVVEAKKIKPDIKTIIHAVPWRDNDFDSAIIEVAAQDLKKFSPLVDYISPMCYSQMLKREPEWVASVVEDMNHKFENRVLPSIQVYKYDDDFTESTFRINIVESLKAPSLGVVFWSWATIESDPSKIKLIKELVN